MKKNFLQKTICLFIAFVMLAVSFTFPAAAEENPRFSDVSEDHWAYDYIYECSSRGIINGYPDGTFKPEKQLQACEFIKMVCCAYAKKEFRESYIKDLNLPSDSHWARPYVIGWGGTFFHAEDYETDESLEETITRFEAAYMIVCMYLRLNYDNEEKNNPDGAEEYIKNIKDADLIEREFDRITVGTAIKYGLINGFDDGTFRPYDGLTRAQAAKIIYLALTN